MSDLNFGKCLIYNCQAKVQSQIQKDLADPRRNLKNDKNFLCNKGPTPDFIDRGHHDGEMRNLGKPSA